MRRLGLVFGLIGACPLLLIAQPQSLGPPSKFYAIQCGKFATQPEADNCESRVRAQGFGPVTQLKDDEGGIHVYFGRFETNSEAWAIKSEMSEFGLLDVSISALDNTAGEDVQTECTAPVEPLIVTPSPKYQCVAGFVERDDDTTRPFLDAVRQKNRDLMIASGVSLIDQLSDTDPMKGHVIVSTCRALVQRDKQSAGALPYLLRIAKGDVAASQEDLVDARFMTADCWHYYWFAPLKAYRAYKEILAAHGDDPGVRARCMVEMAACLLELARMPDREWRASFDDARRACNRILAQMPAQYDRARATADLMYGESFIFEADDPKYGNGLINENERRELYTKALGSLAGFAGRYPGRVRECAMADNMTAFAYGKTGEWDKCKALYLKMLAADFSDPSENFYWSGEQWNLHEMAAKALVRFAREYGDADTVQEYQTKLATDVYKPSTSLDSSGFDFAFPHKFYETPRPEGALTGQ